jgi:Domain of unknown function (DUF4123)
MEMFADFLKGALALDAAPNLYRYLVIDSAATRPVNLATELGLGTTAIDILTGEPCNWRDGASPVLLPLTSVAAREGACHRVRASLWKWRFANCFVYVESEAAPDVMVKLLRDRTCAVLPQELPVLLRFYDPRVFAALLITFDTSQANALLAGASRWAIPGRRGELKLIERNVEPSVSAPLPFVLTALQESALIDAGEADAMVDLLLNQNNADLMELMPPDQHERIDASLNVAMSSRIDKLADQVSFCSLGLALGPDFHEGEPWAASMISVRAGRTSFSEAMAQISEREDQMACVLVAGIPAVRLGQRGL